MPIYHSCSKTFLSWKDSKQLQDVVSEFLWLCRSSIMSSGFTGVECGPEIYSHPLESLIAAKSEAKVEVALINSPRG